MADNMRKTAKLVALVIAGMTLAGIQNIQAHDGASGVVKERMDNFKATQQHLKAISQLMLMDEYDEIVDRAGKMRAWGAEITSKFQEGSGGGVSDAKAEIWTNFEDFSQHADKHVAALDGLISAAKAGDSDALEGAFKAVAGTCKGCHMKYREL